MEIRLDPIKAGLGLTTAAGAKLVTVTKQGLRDLQDDNNYHSAVDILASIETWISTHVFS
jgi:hypothetical protein